MPGDKTITTTIVAWCPHAQQYSDDPGDISTTCYMCDGAHVLRKRRGYICSTCSLRNVFFSRNEFLAHQCE